MSTMHLTATADRQPTSDTAYRWLVPGLSAGATFLGIEMLAGSLASDPWRFPSAIAETIGVNSPLSPALGVAIHFAFSVLLGAVFIAWAERFQVRGRKLLVAGVLFMWAESAISIWLVLHNLYPNTLPILLAAVPFWASLLGRTTFGLVLAAVYGTYPQKPNGGPEVLP
jgi:hypothetical protein